MEEKKYLVKDHLGSILASNMSFDMTLVFIKGFRDVYFNEKIDLRIMEEENGQSDTI